MLTAGGNWLGFGLLEEENESASGPTLHDRRKKATAGEIEDKNKTLVLRAFDTLFNKRDYAAAERFWSPKYIQHGAHIGPGREGLFDLIKAVRQR